jgi:TonB-dependent SusC/RagA subfamily outer membrane receptor
VNGKELSAAEVRKIDKNKIVTIEIKGPEKDRKKSVMVMNLKPANANGDSSVIKRNDTKGIGTNKPLIVIDGKVMEAGFDMNSIKPNDIASISILKDKSATAVYGEKGKNGVMEITLKKKN